MPSEHESRKATKNVAVVIDLEWVVPWHQDCYRGVMAYAEEQGWRCVLDLYAAGVDGDLSKSNYDGVVGRIPVDVAKRMTRLGVPLSNLTPYVESNPLDQASELPGVYVDKTVSISMSVEHLAGSGYPRMAVVTEEGAHLEPLMQKAKAPCEAMRLEWEEPFVLPIHHMESAEVYASTVKGLGEWLAALPKPIGLVVDLTTHARLIAHTCLANGLRIPQDVGIITPIGDRVMLLSGKPTISAVECDYFSQGYEAAALLDQLMRGERPREPKRWIKPVELVQRDSTDVFLCDDKLVSEAMRYIAAHSDTELSTLAIAEHLGVSRWTLHRRFVEASGKTPQQQIHRLRAEHIKRKLRGTDETVAEVAYHCGFTNPSHFSRFFKRESGYSPSAYRERFLNRKQ